MAPPHNRTDEKKLLALAAACVATLALAQDAPQMDLPRVKLTAGMHLIDAQVASTNDQRMTGLMFRKDMPQHEGMLFVFEYPSPQCFWMKNTLLPLSVAFVADDGRIVNIDEMAPQTLDSHCSAGAGARYVLEMNKELVRQEGHQGGRPPRGASRSRRADVVPAQAGARASRKKGPLTLFQAHLFECPGSPPARG